MEDLVKETEHLTINDDSVMKDAQKSISEEAVMKDVKENSIESVEKITDATKDIENASKNIEVDEEKEEITKNIEEVVKFTEKIDKDTKEETVVYMENTEKVIKEEVIKDVEEVVKDTNETEGGDIEEEGDEEIDEDVETVSYNDGDVEDDTNVSDEEREDGDGQEESSAATSTKPVDDDVDKRNPQYIPKKGNFYEHDNRADSEKNAENEDKKPEKSGGKHEKKNASDKWVHDRYDENEQTPKSKSELVSKYGYDIRNEDGPPKSRRRRRYTRGQTKYTRNWADETAYVKPQQSSLTSKRPALRPYRSTKTTSSSLIRQRTRSREQKNVVVKSTTTATTTTTANTTTDDEVRKKDDLEPEVNKDDTKYQPEVAQLEPLVQQLQPSTHIEKKVVEKRKVFYKTSTIIPTPSSHRTRHSTFGSNANNKFSQHYPQHAYNRSLRLKEDFNRLHNTGNNRNVNINQTSRSRQVGDNHEYNGGVFVGSNSGRNSGFNRQSYNSQRNNFTGNSNFGYNNRNLPPQTHYPQQNNRRSCYITSDEFDSQQTTTSNSSNDYVKKSSGTITLDSEHNEQKPNVKRYSSMRQKSAPDLQTGSSRSNNIGINQDYNSSNEHAESSERYYRSDENPVSTVVFVVKRSSRDNNRNNDFYNNSNNNSNNSYLGGYRANNNRGPMNYNRNHEYNHQHRRSSHAQQQSQIVTPSQQYVMQASQQQTQQQQQPAFIQAPSTCFTPGAPAQILNFSTPPPPPNHTMYTVAAPPPHMTQQQAYGGFTAPHHPFNQSSQPTTDIYQTQQGGITYYAPHTQVYHHQNTIKSHQKRPKAAIPIVSPSDVQQQSQMILTSNTIPYIANEDAQLQPQSQSVQERLEDDDQSDIELYPISVVATEEGTIVVNQ